MSIQLCVCVCVCVSNYVVLHLCHLFSDPDLQVKVSPRGDRSIYLECDSMCGNAPIIWYKNGQYYGQVRSYWEYINSVNSYSCAVEGYERLHSPSQYPTSSMFFHSHHISAV
ncbi:hypothetical protein N1851_018955 [Merluccius polli]|uniref:Ig-like domain-containing protein n=1 Tax=Merluccius polli TaxID=89951 RepID=A0AA47MMY5_MERPO|nr:hypothetical protein N1851_018955 [Merluccius polli]